MNDNRLQKWALFAEIIGGLAVVVTLVFLIYETRENTNAIQAQTYQSLTAELNRTRETAILSDLNSLQMRRSTEGVGSLTPSEIRKVRFLAQSVWGVYESAYYAQIRGILGEQEWSRFSIAICRNYVGDADIWIATEDNQQNGISSNITPVFRSYVEDSCK